MTISALAAEKTGLAEDLFLVVTRGEDFRMDRYLAKDGTFIGSSDIASYNSDISRSVWRFDKGEAVVLLDGVINFFNTEEWVFTGCAGQCGAYSSVYRAVVSVENIDGYKPVWYPRYTLEELIEKGKEFLKGLELSDSEKSIYGISD